MDSGTIFGWLTFIFWCLFGCGFTALFVFLLGCFMESAVNRMEFNHYIREEIRNGRH